MEKVSCSLGRYWFCGRGLRGLYGVERKQRALELLVGEVRGGFLGLDKLRGQRIALEWSQNHTWEVFVLIDRASFGERDLPTIINQVFTNAAIKSFPSRFNQIRGDCISNHQLLRLRSRQAAREIEDLKILVYRSIVQFLIFLIHIAYSLRRYGMCVMVMCPLPTISRMLRKLEEDVLRWSPWSGDGPTVSSLATGSSRSQCFSELFLVSLE